MNFNARENSYDIYYCVSNDINNKNSDKNNQSIWQSSLIKLPFALIYCQCIITHQKSKNPKLIILGGDNQKNQATNTYLEYNLCDIMGYENFYRFIIDIKQA